jgi:hypothetical protein
MQREEQKQVVDFSEDSYFSSIFKISYQIEHCPSKM